MLAVTKHCAPAKLQQYLVDDGHLDNLCHVHPGLDTKNDNHEKPQSSFIVQLI